MANGNGNGVWKWVAAMMASIMLAGLPGVYIAIRSPSNEDVTVIRDRQLQVLTRLSALEVIYQSLEKQIQELKDQLDRHIQGSR